MFQIICFFLTIFGYIATWVLVAPLIGRTEVILPTNEKIWELAPTTGLLWFTVWAFLPGTILVLIALFDLKNITLWIYGVSILSIGIFFFFSNKEENKPIPAGNVGVLYRFGEPLRVAYTAGFPGLMTGIYSVEIKPLATREDDVTDPKGDVNLIFVTGADKQRTRFTIKMESKVLDWFKQLEYPDFNEVLRAIFGNIYTAARDTIGDRNITSDTEVETGQLSTIGNITEIMQRVRNALGEGYVVSSDGTLYSTSYGIRIGRLNMSGGEVVSDETVKAYEALKRAQLETATEAERTRAFTAKMATFYPNYKNLTPTEVATLARLLQIEDGTTTTTENVNRFEIVGGSGGGLGTGNQALELLLLKLLAGDKKESPPKPKKGKDK